MADRLLPHLRKLESESVHILREAYASVKSLCMLWSIGKDSTVLLWLTKKAFFGHVPFPLVHIDTSFKIPEMIEYRNDLARRWKLELLYGQNERALAAGETFASGKLNRIQCCQTLKTEALKSTLNATGPRYRLNRQTGAFEPDLVKNSFTGVIAGIRADEEGTRSKERYFSPRDQKNQWNMVEQPPEFWAQFNSEFAPGTHVRIHPLLDWTELNIWEYIEAQNIPTVSLYYDQGSGKRYRSLGCYPCTKPVESTAKNPREIIAELRTGKFASVAERSGRDQDKDDGGGLEILRKGGYM